MKPTCCVAYISDLNLPPISAFPNFCLDAPSSVIYNLYGSHAVGTKLCRHKTNTVCNCSHDAGSMSVSSLLLFCYLNFTLIIYYEFYCCVMYSGVEYVVCCYSECISHTRQAEKSALYIVDNIYHSQNVSSNRNETLMVTCSHSAEMV